MCENCWDYDFCDKRKMCENCWDCDFGDKRMMQKVITCCQNNWVKIVGTVILVIK